MPDDDNRWKSFESEHLNLHLKQFLYYGMRQASKPLVIRTYFLNLKGWPV